MKGLICLMLMCVANACAGWTTAPYDYLGFNLYIEDCEKGGVCFQTSDVCPPPNKNLKPKVVRNQRGAFGVYVEGELICTLMKCKKKGGYFIYGTKRYLIECPDFVTFDEWLDWHAEREDAKSQRARENKKRSDAILKDG